MKNRNLSLKNNKIAADLITYEHNLIKGSRVITLDKLISTEIYSILILKIQNKPSTNIYFKNLFNHDDIDCNSYATTKYFPFGNWSQKYYQT